FQAAEAEEALEQWGRLVEDRPELRAAAVLDQAALLERGDRGLRGDAADAGDLRARNRLEVGHDGEALGLRLRERRGARLGEQAARGPLGVGDRGEGEAAAD